MCPSKLIQWLQACGWVVGGAKLEFTILVGDIKNFKCSLLFVSFLNSLMQYSNFNWKGIWMRLWIHVFIYIAKITIGV